MDLDFSSLTDDQLVALIRAACADAVKRGQAVAAAAQDAYLSEAERARVAQAATLLEAERLRQVEVEQVAREAADKLRREAERQKINDVATAEAELWAKRKGIAQALADAGWDCSGDQLVVWLSPAKEKRVFLQKSGFGGTTWATLYVTGNGRHAPDSIEFGRISTAMKTALPPVLRAIAREWNAIKVELERALEWAGTPIPPKYVAPPSAGATP